ncbi:hypothetical protein Q765_17860 [Flavobacterium rivuli WB 3.3-2 = DSM 21788]|uniref:Lipoprotein n=1 Tax=Flavobacterium rivuli WB 3.3-2 = DSM 21788 TaxID=1121895 RepID=A0A0A2LXL1_9FLAO|nr:hypothetical protein [Flavobacterium rivuli]KGO85117.1 hypothetical protein Q765_17860 [Flavobacterium rivuli WB 3.3-2 = DSM 21788]
MKKIVYVFFAAALFAVSCSSNDDTTATPPATGDTSYLPLATGKFWIYEITGSAESGSDSLYVANDTVIGANTYKKFKTKDTPFGFYSSALSNNGVKKDGDKIVVTGSTTLSISEAVPFTIGVSDLVIFKESATNDEVLSNVTGSVTQNYNGFPVIVNYTLTTTSKQDVASLVVNNQTYTNLKTVETTIYVALSTTLSGVTFPVVANQKIVTSLQYYAQNTGVVKTVTDFQYQVPQEIATQFGIPASSQQHQEELLLRHNLE